MLLCAVKVIKRQRMPHVNEGYAIECASDPSGLFRHHNSRVSENSSRWRKHNSSHYVAPLFLLKWIGGRLGWVCFFDTDNCVPSFAGEEYITWMSRTPSCLSVSVGTFLGTLSFIKSISFLGFLNTGLTRQSKAQSCLYTHVLKSMDDRRVGI